MRSTRVLTVTLPTEMLEDAKRLAKEEDLTMSELVREALKLYQRQKRPNSVSKLSRYNEG
jgi:metal-responsive CopG/Arc/MetJ family transcriptional regulator